MRYLATFMFGALCVFLFGCTDRVKEPPPFDVASIERDLVATNTLLWKRGIKRLVDGGAKHVPAWLDWLTHENRHVREGVAHALGDIAPPSDVVVQALIKAFDDPDDYVRWKAARALGEIGPPAKAALPMLEIAANAEREAEVVRSFSGKAVHQIRGLSLKK